MKKLYSALTFLSYLLMWLFFMLFFVGLILGGVILQNDSTIKNFIFDILAYADYYMRDILPHHAYPLGRFVSAVYSTLIFSLLNVLFSSYEVDLYDMTTSY